MEKRFFTIGAIEALRPFVDDEEALDVILNYYKKNKRIGLGLGGASQPITGIHCNYYFYHGRMYDWDREYMYEALEDANFCRWHNIKLLYGDYIPAEFSLYWTDPRDGEEVYLNVELNFLTMPYITHFESENG